MNRIGPYLFVCVALCGPIGAEERKIAYERDEKIFVANLDGTHAKKIADGALPAISPDGTRIAFNTEGDAKNRPGPERHVAIADVASGKVTVLPNIPGDNCSIRFGRRTENGSPFQLWPTRRGNSVW